MTLGVVVEQDAAAEQLHVRLDGKTAVLQYRRRAGTILFVHTEVPAELQHRGIADALAHAGLEFARAQHLAVIPRCPFVAAYIRRHPEYRSLVEAR